MYLTESWRRKYKICQKQSFFCVNKVVERLLSFIFWTGKAQRYLPLYGTEAEVLQKEIQLATRNNRHSLHNPNDVVTAQFPSHISASVTQQIRTLHGAAHPTPCTERCWKRSHAGGHFLTKFR